MICPDKGTWQAYLDNEVTEDERCLLTEHAKECPQCFVVIKELSELDQWCAAHLNKYQKTIEENVPPQIYKDIRPVSVNKTNENQRVKGVFWMSNKFKKWTAVAASAVILTGALTFTPLKDAVADFLSVFRVQKIQTIKVSPDEMEQMAKAVESKLGEVDLEQFGKMEVVKKYEDVNVTFDQAQSKVPFKIKQPDYIPFGYTMEEKVRLQTDGKAEFKLNVDQVNSLLKGLGAKTLLPTTLEGKAFGIKMPAGVYTHFTKEEGNWIRLSQIDTPEVIVPAGVDPADLRSALLDLPILPDDFRRQIASIEDWQNTLILPDNGKDKIEKINIGGNEAIFTQDNQFGTLLWVDNGEILQITGSLDREEIIKIAQSLK